MFARDLARTLVHFALHEGSKPRLHPNGFVQLDLVPSGDVRFHVWPAQRLDVHHQETHHPIHDHGFDMESLVLTGQMTNVLYGAFPAVGMPPRQSELATCGDMPLYVLYKAERIAGVGETILKRFGGSAVALYVRKRVIVEAGQTYTMPADTLHDSQPRGLTATIMTKARHIHAYAPVVAVPVGVQPDNGFRRAVSEDVLRGTIDQALESITLIKGECDHEKDVRGNCCFQFDKSADVNSLFRVNQPRCC